MLKRHMSKSNSSFQDLKHCITLVLEPKMATQNPNNRKILPKRFPQILIWAWSKSLLEFRFAIPSLRSEVIQ